ncbi:serine/threonine protein phosphatase PrpC [Flavobacterium gossypii]|uniref:Serine/threonine protein phosphatase PrpC n=1 Tax=Flavobacterium gossypii TaxID=1646119 RepID=A0ABR6DW58_9FLAO|nr:PP2C family serine/threonine-protein phosphatase [Flavobacterium gossypii]MBA9075095.1 serine/threonine protein phosphatase PrpC [Flavobacterium gossypii]
MTNTKKYIQQLLVLKEINISPKNEQAFQEFVSKEENISKVKLIQELQKQMAKDWELINRKLDIQNQQILFPNGTVGKEYLAPLDFDLLDLSDLNSISIDGLEIFGLAYNPDKKYISGIPLESGNLKFNLFYKINEDDTNEFYQKTLSIIFNPDPKSLWKSIPSNTEDVYWKKDDVSEFYSLEEKSVVVASKRGRSHANKGSFRDDDYAIKHFPENNWSLIAVSDGAGSAVLGRKGAEIACNAVVTFFQKYFDENTASVFDQEVLNYRENTENSLREAKIQLLNASRFANQQIQDAANKIEVSSKDFHATLIFTLLKKFDFGYAILAFGVGDCPIGVISKDQTSVELMNKIDVGEFGGGTRFITMPEIFEDENFESRFSAVIVEDFSYFFLMTDGIYDPKFEVEANLKKIEKWNSFIEDLKGKNEDQLAVNFQNRNQETATQLSEWMDFWSPGNHDDRTLAIIY